MPKQRGLSPRHRRFVEEYLVDLNASQAAKRSGFSSDWARKLIRRPEVAAAIAEAQAARAERTRVSADKVVTELAKVAFGDPRRLLSWGPGGVVLRDSAELTEAEAALVSEIAETRSARGGTRRVKLHCKLTALNALARHLGLFGDGRRPGASGADDGAEGGEAADDARERLARRIAGLAERLGPGTADPGAE